MSEDEAAHTEEQQTKPRRLRPWRSTRRQVLWAVGTLGALVTIALLVALLVVNLDAVKWKDLLSRERIEQVALFIGIAVAVTTLIVLLAIGGASVGWTGFADKTLWEWLQLLGALAIPLVLAIAGFWFTSQQEARQQWIETQRAEAERELAEQRAQDEALQAYLDQMGTLLLGKGLRESKEGSEVRTLARARTLTVLGRLDPSRRTQVMQFLIEAELVHSSAPSSLIIQLVQANREYTIDPPVISLDTASLHDVDLGQVHLHGAYLNDAVLSDADLTDADLVRAALIDADLRGANLRGASLNHAFLSGADLSGALFLSAADLMATDLSYANLDGATGVTKEMLEQAESLRGATMPDGQTLKSGKRPHGPTYEDWRKDTERSGENRENRDSS